MEEDFEKHFLDVKAQEEKGLFLQLVKSLRKRKGVATDLLLNSIALET